MWDELSPAPGSRCRWRLSICWLLGLSEFLGGCSFSPQDFASFGLGYLCGSSAPGDADAWGAIALVTEEGQDQTGRGEIELE